MVPVEKNHLNAVSTETGSLARAGGGILERLEHLS